MHVLLLAAEMLASVAVRMVSIEAAMIVPIMIVPIPVEAVMVVPIPIKTIPVETMIEVAVIVEPRTNRYCGRRPVSRHPNAIRLVVAIHPGISGACISRAGNSHGRGCTESDSD